MELSRSQQSCCTSTPSYVTSWLSLLPFYQQIDAAMTAHLTTNHPMIDGIPKVTEHSQRRLPKFPLWTKSSKMRRNVSCNMGINTPIACSFLSNAYVLIIFPAAPRIQPRWSQSNHQKSPVSRISTGSLLANNGFTQAYRKKKKSQTLHNIL